jgi:acyl-CoA thioester hydrolase
MPGDYPGAGGANRNIESPSGFSRKPSATVRRRIEFVDTDASGRYHYATAMRLFEAAEAELLDRLGLLDEIYQSMPRAHVEFDYRRVLRFRDEVESTVWIERAGRTSVTLGFELSSAGEICVQGHLIAVFVDDEGEPTPWSDPVRELLEGRTRP